MGFKLISTKDARPFVARGLKGPKEFLSALKRTQEAGGKVSTKVSIVSADGTLPLVVTYKSVCDCTDPLEVEKFIRTQRGTVGKAAEFVCDELFPGLQPGGEVLPSDMVRWIGLEPAAEKEVAETAAAEPSEEIPATDNRVNGQKKKPAAAAK